MDYSLRKLAKVIGGEVAYPEDEYHALPGASLIAQVRWDIVKIGVGSPEKWPRGKDGTLMPSEQWDILKAKALNVEANYEGSIRFTSAWYARWSTIHMREWKDDSQSLDRALHKVFRHPRKLTYKGERRIVYPELGY